MKISQDNLNNPKFQNLKEQYSKLEQKYEQLEMDENTAIDTLKNTLKEMEDFAEELESYYEYDTDV